MLGYGFTPRQGYVPQPNLQIKTFFDLNKVLIKQNWRLETASAQAKSICVD